MDIISLGKGKMDGPNRKMKEEWTCEWSDEKASRTPWVLENLVCEEDYKFLSS